MRRGWAFSLAAALLLTLSLAAPIPGAASGLAAGAAAATAAEMAIAGMQAQLAPPTVAVVVLDGCPAYAIEQLPEEAFLRRLWEGEVGNGFSGSVRAVFPSSTAAGHAAIFTGTYPEENGITGKGYLGDDGSVWSYDSPEFFERPTLFHLGKSLGMRTVMVSAKATVLRRLADGVDVLIYSDEYPDYVAEKVGDPPPLFEQYDDYAGWHVRLDLWLLDALRVYLETEVQSSVIGVNLGSPDKCGHRYGPVPAAETMRAMESVSEGLERVAQVLEATRPGNWCMVITADHGMTYVDKGVTLGDMVDAAVEATGGDVALTLDGGCVFIWSDEDTCGLLADSLREHPGVDEVIEADDVERRAELRIRHSRVPPLIAISREGFMFIESEVLMDYTKGSHGTLLDTDLLVPAIVFGPKAPEQVAGAGAMPAGFDSLTDIYALVEGMIK
ncbi:MAG: alkaline phosphatase family protein [Bacillota bacterium]|jgi:predicted AlkP superfamily pyrophosphatase or phosphodiesterase|nr:alkaline phosphatase family protein [Bacillota bacterium]